MRSGSILVIAALLVAAGCGAREPRPGEWNPNPGPPPRDENFHGGPNAMLLKYDASKDGTLTRDELMAGLRRDFDGYDAQKTGCLNSDTVADINQARIAEDQSAANPLQDWNGDGCLNFAEFATTPLSLFIQLDRNRDSRITPQEFDPRKRLDAKGGVQTGQETPPPGPPREGAPPR